MVNEFNPNRLKIARLRRKMTYKELANKIGLTSKTISKYENDGFKHPPTDEALIKLAKALRYPVKFFFENNVDELPTEAVSFRALSKMTASYKNAAIAAGRLAFIVTDYIDNKFELPSQDFKDLRGVEPEAAAEMIRDYWALGNRKVDNIIHLLESKGARVFSLAENTLDVDAFSFWKNETPFIFLNNKKSAEHSRFDSAHELGHLLLHKHASPFDDYSDNSNRCSARGAEQQADDFASAFLMPQRSVIEAVPTFITLESVVDLKSKWGVSAVSLIVRLKKLNLVTDWQYRRLMQEAAMEGYRKKEPKPIEREKSLVFEKLLPLLEDDGFSVKNFANELHLPLDEVTNLMFMPRLVS